MKEERRARKGSERRGRKEKKEEGRALREGGRKEGRRKERGKERRGIQVAFPQRRSKFHVTLFALAAILQP